MRIFFVVHGNSNIGMGHVMRSLSLAEAFRERGHEVSFFSKYRLGADIICNKGFKIISDIVLEENTNIEGFYYGSQDELAEDIRCLASNISGVFDVIFVDSYNVTQEFFIELKSYSKSLVYIDDLNQFSYPVDVLINGTAAALGMGYEKMQSAYLLLGLQYNLIRKEFRSIPPHKVNFKVEDVLITTGNSDPFHMTELLLSVLRDKQEFKDLKFHVIMGSGFGSESLLKSNILNDVSVFLYDKPNNMSEIMQKCDLAISSGGSTLYELAACGVPSIVFAYADNQIPQIISMKEQGLLQYIGEACSIDKTMLVESIRYMQRHYENRRELTRRLQSLVDAQGVLRIVKIMERWYEEGNYGKTEGPGNL